MSEQKRLFVFVLCTRPQSDENKSRITKLKQRYQVRVLTSPSANGEDLKDDLIIYGQKEAYFVPLDGPDEWEMLLREYGNGERTAMTLVMS